MPRRCRSFVIMIATLIQMVARSAAEAISHGIVNGEAVGVLSWHRPHENGEDGHGCARQSNPFVGARSGTHARGRKRARGSRHLVGQQRCGDRDDVVAHPHVGADEGASDRDDGEEDEDREEDVTQHHVSVRRFGRVGGC